MTVARRDLIVTWATATNRSDMPARQNWTDMPARQNWTDMPASQNRTDMNVPTWRKPTRS
jgi:hypothetical protein